AHRGRGAGRLLVEARIERARGAGRRRLVLLTRPEYAAARALYERLGFRRDPERDLSPVPGVDLIGYQLDLA
ncbi:MAG TPA: GNAT family N-acetyltransferase, partial [Candidatus Limnocylindrales bacterium]